MAELETAAWKDDRRFRIMAEDGGALSFADLFFHTPNSPSRPGRKEDRMATKENGAEGLCVSLPCPFSVNIIVIFLMLHKIPELELRQPFSSPSPAACWLHCSAGTAWLILPPSSYGSMPDTMPEGTAAAA